MTTFLLIICVFGFIATLCYFGGTMLLGQNESQAEDRLANLLNKSKSGEETEQINLLRSGLDEGSSRIEQLLSGFSNLSSFLEQSGLTLTPTSFASISIGIGVGAGLIHGIFLPFKFLAPVTGIALSCLPFMYVAFCRNKRLAKYSEHLPDALSMMGNALRAGQSLPAGFQLVAEQTPAPLGPEFARCFEEQNLGVPLDKALEEMTKRAPNVDLKFFATAVILQRQTGGDLSEILDKIARLIRERFQIHGMIMALTGEGRLSGTVLLGLSPALALIMMYMNPDYIWKLFTEPLGNKMLAGAIFMQTCGYFWIKKIVSIKV